MATTVKKTLSLFTELKEHYKLLINISQTVKAPNKVVRSLLKKGKLSYKLNVLGLGLILFPEPTGISDMAGLPFLAFGRLIDKLHTSLSIGDMVQKAHDEINELSFYRDEYSISENLRT